MLFGLFGSSVVIRVCIGTESAYRIYSNFGNNLPHMSDMFDTL